jgi:outer membrane lipoprotein-sorting protein
MAARYSVTTYAAVLDQRNETAGRLFLQRDKNRLRLEEDGQTIVSDGESLWTYVHGNRQVIVSPAQDDAAGTRPDEFIFNYSNRYRYDLEGREPVDGTPCYVLGLTAVAPTDGIPALRIWVDEGTWLTKKVVYSDDMGSETTLRFMDFKLNTKLPPGLFTMTTPEDVEWVDLR